MLMFIPTYGIVLLIRFFAVITKYTVLDEQRREAKEGKSQRKNPRSITSGATQITACTYSDFFCGNIWSFVSYRKCILLIYISLCYKMLTHFNEYLLARGFILL